MTTPLKPLALQRFPTHAITPRGWLADQLRLQADSLSGNLDQFWPDIKDSAWIGGSAEGWERFPYWLDGVIPLAWLLADVAFQQRLTGYIDTIIARQQPDGWLGPRPEHNPEAADLWSQALACKMLIEYYLATDDARVPTVIQKALLKLDRHLDHHPLTNWGQARWFEFLIAIAWLYERQPEQWLRDLAARLYGHGFHWRGFFQHWPHRQRTATGRWNYSAHVVNNAMAIKEGGLWWRFSGDEADRTAAWPMLHELDRYHGMPTGVFTGDECLAGNSADQGTELCAVVETMYSLEWLISVLGEPLFADRLERIAFNALPATISSDMWSHQYDQQLNQRECTIRDDWPWTTNAPDSNIFGLEPQFGCCTANFSQGWPKLAAHLWMSTPAPGIAAVAYAPSQLTTTIHDTAVTITLETDYPFGDDLRFTVHTDSPVRFPFSLRIPGWTVNPTLAIDGHSHPLEAPVNSSPRFHTIDRKWADETIIELTLPMPIRRIPRPNQAVSISRGPLLLALPIGERWERIHEDLPHRELPHADWQLHPTTAWNYGLTIPQTDQIASAETATDTPLTTPVFSPESAPLRVSLTARRIPEWTGHHGMAGPLPSCPAHSDQPDETITLIPYGCTNLRIAEFPTIATGKE